MMPLWIFNVKKMCEFCLHTFNAVIFIHTWDNAGMVQVWLKNWVRFHVNMFECSYVYGMNNRFVFFVVVFCLFFNYNKHAITDVNTKQEKKNGCFSVWLKIWGSPFRRCLHSSIYLAFVSLAILQKQCIRHAQRWLIKL